MEVKDGGVYLSFRQAESGLYKMGELKGFVVAGQDKVFYPAVANIVGGKKLFVKAQHVKDPVAVRYAWRSWDQATLFDTFLLPASSFRTDNWNDATEKQFP
jgi:sialate O-acetylesterase